MIWMVCYWVNTQLECVPLFLASLLSASMNWLSSRIIHNLYIERNASPYAGMIVATNAICYESFTYEPNCTFYVYSSHDIGTWLSNCYMTFNHDCQIVTWHSTLTVKEIVTWHLALNCHTNCLMTFNPWLSMKLSHDIQPLTVTLIVTWHSTLTVKQIVTWHLFHAWLHTHIYIHTYQHHQCHMTLTRAFTMSSQSVTPIGKTEHWWSGQLMLTVNRTISCKLSDMLQAIGEVETRASSHWWGRDTCFKPLVR